MTEKEELELIMLMTQMKNLSLEVAERGGTEEDLQRFRQLVEEAEKLPVTAEAADRAVNIMVLAEQETQALLDRLIG